MTKQFDQSLELGDLVQVIEGTEDPLALGVQLLSADQSELQVERAMELAQRYGSQVKPQSARLLKQLAGSYASRHPEAAGRHLGERPAQMSAAAGWLRAMLLQATKEYKRAALELDELLDWGWDEGRAMRLLALARARMEAGDRAGALAALGETAKATLSYRTLSTVDRLLSRQKRAGTIPSKRRCRIALIGSVTMDFVAPALRAVCHGCGIDAEIYTGPFGQYQQDLLLPHSGLAVFSPEIVFIATDWRSLGLDNEVADPLAAIEERVTHLRDLWAQCRSRWGAFVVQHNFEVPATDAYGRLSATLSGGRGRLIRQLNLRLWEVEREEPGVAVLDVEQVSAVVGKNVWNDSVLWHSVKQYPAPAGIPALVRHQAALIRAILGLSSKCLVLDLDGTLWGGVIGEDGLSGIRLGGGPEGEAYVAFQHYVRSLKRKGVVLAVCSKNNDADARLPFGQHPEMVLRLDDIAMFVANWRPKDENLRMIAETINIGLDTLVLVDDSFSERLWVRHRLPEVEVPELPQDPALYVDTLARHMYFETLSITDEDRQRSTSYRENVNRKELESSSSDIDAFLSALRMGVELQPFRPVDLVRITQLINKTNQFNLTTRRMTESQVQALIGSSNHYTQTMRLRDRLGDNGLTGILVGVIEGQELRIDNWLMSCRVLGRRVEEVMFAAVVRFARDRGLSGLLGEYIPTAKNEPVKGLYERLGFDCIAESEDGSRRYRWDPSRQSFEAPDKILIEDFTQRN